MQLRTLPSHSTCSRSKVALIWINPLIGIHWLIMLSACRIPIEREDLSTTCRRWQALPTRIRFKTRCLLKCARIYSMSSLERTSWKSPSNKPNSKDSTLTTVCSHQNRSSRPQWTQIIICIHACTRNPWWCKLPQRRRIGILITWLLSRTATLWPSLSLWIQEIAHLQSPKAFLTISWICWMGTLLHKSSPA